MPSDSRGAPALTGTNQHFIPQALLRQFRYNATGRARVHVYRVNEQFDAATRNVASQDHFYSDGDAEGEPLDTTLTRHENGPFNIDFQTLIKLPVGPVDPALAARIVAHLVGRGDHLRGMIRTGTEVMGELIGELFGDTDNIARLLGADGPMPGPRFHEVFEESIAENIILTQLGLPGPVVEALCHMMLRESRQVERDETAEVALAAADRFREQGYHMARRAHVSALAKSHTSEARVAQLLAFQWRIVEVPAPGTVLPDLVVLARDTAGRPGSIFTYAFDELDELLMPLSPHRMLVGQLIEHDPGVDRFNAEAIPLCFQFLVSAYLADELATAAAEIGRDMDVPARTGLDEAAAEFRALVSSPADAPGDDAGDWRSRQGQPFSVETDEYETEEAERLGQVLLQLLRLARDRFDTDNLRRFVIRADYEAAIAGVERGAFDDGVPLAPTTEGGLSLAYNVPVERDGDQGLVVVLRSGVGAMLLSEDDFLFGAAANTVLSQLARIGADQLLGTVFANGFTEGEEHDRLILRSAIWAWKSWLVGQYQAMFSDDVVEHYREQLLEQLASLGERLTEARRHYRVDHDVDALIESVIAIASGVLSVAACTAATSRDDESWALFRAQLDETGWAKWFSLLERDLAEIWTEGSAYPRQSAFLVLSRHVQRLLFGGAIFLWTPPEGGVRVEIPFWSDLDWLAEQIRLRGEVGELPSA